MALITGVGLFVASVLVAALSKLVAEEVGEWIPFILRRLVKVAVAWLPERQRDRFEEEWQSHLNEVPGKLGKLAAATGFLFAAFNLTLDAQRTQVAEGWSRCLAELEGSQAEVSMVVSAIQDDKELSSFGELNACVDRLRLTLVEAERLRGKAEAARAAALVRSKTLTAVLSLAGYDRVIRRGFDQISRGTQQIREKCGQAIKALGERPKRLGDGL